MQILIYIVIIGLIFVLSKNIIKPFGAQLRLRRSADSITISNLAPITFTYVIVVLLILAYTLYDVKSLNPIILAISAVFIILAVTSGIVNSRIVMGNKEFSYMYSMMKFSEMTKIVITPNIKRSERYDITIRKTNGGELKFSLDESKKEMFKDYMNKHGKRAIERN
ncbi:hypothetical protein HMPREF1092_01855 [Clostridium thermobutyricum]|uniref:Uncharacterized protein n=2 Tax=Clostridium thermobutyricum TaxID=29372 RepID=N9WI92_9CLOT|nr:hypothetical protein [Clostridium thermobutyricum]ENZ02620.1 hypothetical protein HMPREF1092_01855 [Clostridium thermobutyricum]